MHELAIYGIIKCIEKFLMSTAREHSLRRGGYRWAICVRRVELEIESHAEARILKGNADRQSQTNQPKVQINF
jgi:hypothetical protein